MLIPDFDVYLSYAPEDKAKVQDLVLTLESTGLKVWWEHHHLKPKEAIAMLQRQLNVSRVQMVVWSKNSAGSGRVQAEARVGADRGRLIATRIEQIVPPRDTAAVAYADLTDWSGGQEHRGIRKAFAMIWKLIGKGLEVADPPPIPRVITPPQAAPAPTASVNEAPFTIGSLGRRKKKVEEEAANAAPESVEVTGDVSAPAVEIQPKEEESAPAVEQVPDLPKSQEELEEEAWAEVYRKNSRGAYKLFLKQFPDGIFAEEARTALERKSKSRRFFVWALIAFLALYLISFLVLVFINAG